MRLISICLFVLAASACERNAPTHQTKRDQSEKTPALVSDALLEWRDVSADELMLIETMHGTIAIELNADFAPRHVERMRNLAASGVYDGAAFYRVIDGFVAQGGLQDEDASADWPMLHNENDRDISASSFTPLGNPDLFAPIVGHMNGFPAARDKDMGREWLLHCPGAVAMARDEDPDSGRTEFYIVLGAQRYLDRNLTVFGKVIDGMDHVQALNRGNRAIESGVIQPPEKGDAILSVRIGSELAEANRPVYQVMNSNHIKFEDAKTAKRVREEAFFYRKPPEILDICAFDVPVRKIDPALK